MEFNANTVKTDIIKWIKEWFNINGKDCNAVIGISGGKDSTVVAALCTKALGKDRVTGVLMPNGVQEDMDISLEVVKYLGIRHVIINIEKSYLDILSQVQNSLGEVSTQARTNLPARLRMTSLYAVSQSINGRVANTGNLSEAWVGYTTKYGDLAGDFSPLCNLTVGEVKKIGRELKIPDKFIEKVPTDGISGKTDEDNLGFTYQILDKYIREGICEDKEIKAKIDLLHKKNKFKFEPIEGFIRY